MVEAYGTESAFESISGARARLNFVEGVASDAVVLLEDERVQFETEAADWEKLSPHDQERCGFAFYHNIWLEHNMEETVRLDLPLSAFALTQLQIHIRSYLDMYSPFSYGERHMLADSLPESSPEPGEFAMMIAALQQESAEAIVGGRTQVIYGAELFRRWWAWRREVDEFAATGTYQQARVGLRRISDYVLGGELPAAKPPPTPAPQIHD